MIVKLGGFLGISHHFLGAPFEIEQDEILREFLKEARKVIEEGGFGMQLLNAYGNTRGEAVSKTLNLNYARC